MKRVFLFTLIMVLMAMPAWALDFFVDGFDNGQGAWQVVDNIGGGGGMWQDDNPAGRSFANMTAPFMIADSDYYATPAFDTSLISPAIDCTNYTGVTLSFSQTYVTLSGSDNGIVEVWDGAAWQEVANYSTDQLELDTDIDVSTYADGVADFKVRFTYTTNGGTWYWFWAIDNVKLSGTPNGNFLEVSGSNAGSGFQGTTVDYNLLIVNASGAKGTIDLAYSGNSWTTNGPATVDIADGASDYVTVSVDIPTSISDGDSDTVTVDLSISTYSDSIDLTTTGKLGWDYINDLSYPRGDGTAVISGTKVLYIGGTLEGLDVLGEVEIYDTAVDAWTSGTAMSTPLTLISAAEIGGTVYVPGGFDNNALPVTTHLAYDVAGDSWSAKAAAPSDLIFYAAVSDGTYMYRVGGLADADTVYYAYPVNTLNRYDPSGDSWTTLATMPEARYLASAAYYDGKIYVFGGVDASFAALNTMAVYDISTDTWSATKANIPTTYVGGGAAAFCDFLVLVGGSTASGISAETYAYDPSTDTWYSWLPLQKGRMRFGLAGNDTLGVFAVGGWNPLWSAVASLEHTDTCPTAVADDDDDDDVTDDDDDVTDDDDDVVDDDDDTTDDDTTDDDDNTDDDTMDDDDTDDDDTTGGGGGDDDDDDDGCCG